MGVAVSLDTESQEPYKQHGSIQKGWTALREINAVFEESQGWQQLGASSGQSQHLRGSWRPTYHMSVHISKLYLKQTNCEIKYIISSYLKNIIS